MHYLDLVLRKNTLKTEIITFCFKWWSDRLASEDISYHLIAVLRLIISLLGVIS